MKLRFLGTAAAEAIPALWCECPVCADAKRKLGRELRRRTAYLLDSDTLIDFGPDAFWQSIEFGIDLLEIERVIFTHLHPDHLNLVDLKWRLSPAFSRVGKTIDIGASAPVLKAIDESFSRGSFAERHMNPVTFHGGEPLRMGDIKVLPVPACHATGTEAMIYALERGGRSLLIANDTGYLGDKQWALLAGRHFDAAVLESTCALGNMDYGEGHMGANTTVKFRDKLRELGCIDDRSKVFVTHFSHNGRAGHEALCDFFEPKGLTVAYDGLDINV